MPLIRPVRIREAYGALIPLAGSVFITLFTFPALDFQTFSGLDPAYFYALNYFFKEGLVAGRDYIFSYGPLGFLKDPQALAGLATPGVVVIALLRFLTAWTLLMLGRKNGLSLGLALTVVFLALRRLQGLDYVIFILGAGLALRHRTQPKAAYLTAAWSVAAMGALIKLNIGFTTAAFLLTLSASEGPLRQRVKSLAGGIGTFLLVYLLLWLCIYRTWEGSLLYILYSMKLAPDNLAATVLPTATDREALLVSAAFFSLGCLWLFTRQHNPLGLAVWVSFFLVFRYSVARSDFFHLVHGFNIMVAAAALMLLSHAPRPVPVALWGLALLLWRTACHGLDYVPHPIRLPQPQLSGFRQSLWNHHTTVREALEKNALNLEKDSLPAPWLRQIGQEAVDFFPWVSSAAARYRLNYRPRPFMQHGLGADPLFDEITARYLCSEKAAPFMIWHGGWDSTGMKSIDGRYVGAEHVRTLRALWHCYEVVDMHRPAGLLLKRKKEITGDLSTQNLPSHSPEQRKINVAWNTWVALPTEGVNDFVWGRISGTPDPWALLRRWVWKEAVYCIDFMDTAGRIFSHRLALSGARDQMLLNPYFSAFPLLEKPHSIRAVRFRVAEGKPLLVSPFILQLWKAPL